MQTRTNPTPQTRFRPHASLCMFLLLSATAGTFAQETITPSTNPDAPITETQQTVRSALEHAANQIANRQHAAALESLKPVESLEPDNPWLHYFKGTAHLGLENWYPAMDSYDTATDLLLSYGQPEPQLYETIKRYRTQARRNVFSLSLTTGIAWDSNVSYVGDSGSQANLISGQGDAVFSTRFNIAYAPIANETESLTFVARTHNTWHADVDQFDEQDYGFTTNYTRNLTDQWSASLRYDYDIVYLGRQPFVSSHALSPSLRYGWTPTDARLQPTRTDFYYRIEAHDYLFRTATEFDRDGFENSLGLSQSFLWQPNPENPWAMTIDTGYAFEFVATEGREFDQLRHNFYLGFGIPLTSPLLPQNDLQLQINTNVEVGQYREASLIDRDNDERHDVITTIEAIFSQNLVRHPTRGDLTMHAIVGYSTAASNITRRDRSEPFTYEKWITGVQFEWNW